MGSLYLLNNASSGSSRICLVLARSGHGEFGIGVARPCAAAAPKNGLIHALICRKRRIIPAHHANAAWPYLGLIHPSAGAKASASPGPHVPGAYV